MLTANQYNNQESSRGAYNLNNIQQASILLWKNKLKQSMIMPMLLLKPQIEINYKRKQQHHHARGQALCLNSQQDNVHSNCIQAAQKQQNPHINWSQLAQILSSQGPLSSIQLLIQNYQHPQQKMRFRVNINDKEKLIISADWRQNVGEVCDKILIAFFSTFIYPEQQFKANLTLDELPAIINKVKINNKVVQMKDQIGRVAHENDFICVSLAKKNQIISDSQKKILRKYEEYHQRKAKELKEKQKDKTAKALLNSTNGSSIINDSQNKSQNLSSDSNMEDNSRIIQSKLNGDSINKKQKIAENQRIEEEHGEEDNPLIQVKCRILLSFQKVYVDLWDPVEEENVQFSLGQEENIEDLKWLIENYLDIEPERIQLVCQVYAHSKLFEFEEIDVAYELFNKSSSTLQFFNRLKGG